MWTSHRYAECLGLDHQSPGLDTTGPLSPVSISWFSGILGSESVIRPDLSGSLRRHYSIFRLLTRSIRKIFAIDLFRYENFSAPVSQRAVMNVSFKRIGTYGKPTGVIRNEDTLIVWCSVSGGFSVHRDRSSSYSHRSLKSLNIGFDHSDL
ncbi:hypothetical protein TNCV_1283851 [Trichonephila clavipes]|uniref:Uncharacterized protein n=1 Tax=Trichonephila clavipes TaxID=2585209 RepID=A0A8X6VQ84_TRICX|nr:hypothetical protein TNCV_1283851 [Trichonephila clavipes]